MKRVMAVASLPAPSADGDSPTVGRGAGEGARTAAASLESAYRAHRSLVWRILARLGVPVDTLPDALHDVFVVAAKKLDAVPQHAARPWIVAVATQVARGVRRDAARDHRRLEWLRWRRNAIRQRTDPWAQADAGLSVEHFLQALPEAQREVFVLMELEGLTADEVSEALGVKRATVYSRRRLARGHLKDRIDASRGANDGGGHES